MPISRSTLAKLAKFLNNLTVMTDEEIASDLGLAPLTVARWRRSVGVYRPPGRRSTKVGPVLDAREMLGVYSDQVLADFLRVSPRTVRQVREDLRIPPFQGDPSAAKPVRKRRVQQVAGHLCRAGSPAKRYLVQSQRVLALCGHGTAEACTCAQISRQCIEAAITSEGYLGLSSADEAASSPRETP